MVPSRELTSDSELGQVCSPAILGGTEHAKRLSMVALSRAAEAEGCFLQVELVSWYCLSGRSQLSARVLAPWPWCLRRGFEGSRHRLADSDSFFSNPRKFALWLASVMRSRKYQ